MKRDFLSMESWGRDQCMAMLDLADFCVERAY